jgi:hypothetical protein
VSGVHGAVSYQRSGCPDTGVRTSPFELFSLLLGPWAVEGSFVSYKGIRGGFEELWMSGAGSAEEPGLLQRHAQGRVEASLSPRVPYFPLSGLKAAHSNSLC